MSTKRASKPEILMPAELGFSGNTDLGAAGEWESGETLTDEGGSIFQAARAQIEKLEALFAERFPARDLRELSSAKGRAEFWESESDRTADQSEVLLRMAYGCFRDACVKDLLDPSGSAWAYLAEGFHFYGSMNAALSKQPALPALIARFSRQAALRKTEKEFGETKLYAIAEAEKFLKRRNTLPSRAAVVKQIRPAVMKFARQHHPFKSEDAASATIDGWLSKAGLKFKPHGKPKN